MAWSLSHHLTRRRIQNRLPDSATEAVALVFPELSLYIHQRFTLIGEYYFGEVTMTTSQLRAAAATIVGVLFSAGFMLVWLCCWPVYRLVRGNMIRG